MNHDVVNLSVPPFMWYSRGQTVHHQNHTQMATNERINRVTSRYSYLAGHGESGSGSRTMGESDGMVVPEGAHKLVAVDGGTTHS